MTDPNHRPEIEIVEHMDYQIRLSGLEWMAFVARPKQRPILIIAPHRKAAIIEAKEWIEVRLSPAEYPI
jgi:hypothetical protein